MTAMLMGHVLHSVVGRESLRPPQDKGMFIPLPQVSLQLLVLEGP